MAERWYTLNGLARATRRSKQTLLAMIDAGELLATRSGDGRDSWRISHTDAEAAGLEFSEATLDEALARCVQSAVDPVRVDVADFRRHVDERLAELERRLEHSTWSAKDPAYGKTRFVAWLHRVSSHFRRSTPR